MRLCEAITTRQREVCSKRPSLTRSDIQTQHIFAYSLIISVRKRVFSYVKRKLKERYFHNTQNEIRYMTWNNQSHKKIQDFGFSGERVRTKKNIPLSVYEIDSNDYIGRRISNIEKKGSSKNLGEICVTG